ncbi:MAG: hypothetical protein Q8904_03605, partial [Bacteroidota bacterium]|nr:hypothetical protein [Bacteroidota bacterium]
MKVLKIILSVIACLIVIAAMIYANYGGFSNIRIQIKKAGGEILVYRDVKGSYSQTGEIINKINYDLKRQFKIEPLRQFGIYFDNPQKVEQSKLRSEVGCILENADTSKVFWLKARFNIK